MAKRKRVPTETAATPPELAHITALKNDLTTDPDWRRQKSKDRLMDELYYGQHTVESMARTPEMLVDPANYIVKANTARDYIDRYVGLKLTPPRHAVDPRGIGSARQEHAELLEAWLDALGPQIEDEQGGDTNFSVTFESDLMGYCGREVYFDPRVAAGQRPDYADFAGDNAAYNKGVSQASETSPVPICDRHIPAMPWWPLLDGNTVVESLVVLDVRATVVQSRYGRDRSASGTGFDYKALGLKATDLIQLVSHVDDTWCDVWAFGKAPQTGRGQPSTDLPLGTSYSAEPLYGWQHKMPMEPGHAPVTLYEGRITADRRPGRRWVSLLEPIYDICKTEDFVLSRRKLMTAIFYMATLIESWDKNAEPLLDNLADQTGGIDKDFLLGAANKFPKGREVHWLEAPPPLVEAEKLWESCQAKLDRIDPPALRGAIPLSGQTAGYLYNLAARYALAPHKPAADRIARSDAQTARLYCKSVEAGASIAGDPGFKIYTRRRTDRGTEALGMSTEDVSDYGQLIKVKRDLTSEEDNLANLQAMKAATELGWSDEDAAKDFANVQDWQRIKTNRMVQDLERTPALLQQKENQLFADLQKIQDTQDGLPDDAVTQMAPTLPPALARVIGKGGAPVGGVPGPEGLVGEQPSGPTVPPAPVTGPPVGGPSAIPPQAPPPPEPLPVPRRNVRAGQKSQPGGQRIKAKRGKLTGRS